MSIRLVHQASLSPDEIAELGDVLGTFDADISISEAPDAGPQNALEWALPVLLAIIVSAPVKAAADGFFGEMGKDGYQKLKDVLSWLFRSKKGKTTSWTSPNGEERRAPPLAVVLEMHGDSVRFVYPDSLAPEEIAPAFEQMNRNIGFIADMVAWQERQFELIDRHAVELFGPTYPQQDRFLQNRMLLDEIAFGTWVYNSAAKSWIKAQ